MRAYRNSTSYKFAIAFSMNLFAITSSRGHDLTLEPHECRSYGQQSRELEGIVSASPYKWPGKERARHYVSFSLHFGRFICIHPGGDELETGFEGIRNVEIGVRNAREYREIKELVGARVRCVGDLQPAISGYHANSGILWNFVCRNVQSSLR